MWTEVCQRLKKCKISYFTVTTHLKMYLYNCGPCDMRCRVCVRSRELIVSENVNNLPASSNRDTSGSDWSWSLLWSPGRWPVTAVFGLFPYHIQQMPEETSCLKSPICVGIYSLLDIFFFVLATSDI